MQIQHGKHVLVDDLQQTTNSQLYPTYLFPFLSLPLAGTNAQDWCSVSSTSLTVGGTPPRVRHSSSSRGKNISAEISLNPLDILTGEGQSAAAAAGGWLSGTANGERNLVAPGMEAVGALDPEEVRFES